MSTLVAPEPVSAPGPASAMADDDSDKWEVTVADRLEARKYLQFLVESRLGAPKRKIEAISGEREQELCALRKQGLMEYVARCGGDAEQCARGSGVRRPATPLWGVLFFTTAARRLDITVTCKQRKGGDTECGIDFYYHSIDGKRFRSNKEVATKLYKLSVVASASAKKKKNSIASDGTSPTPPPPAPVPTPTPNSITNPAALATPPA